ncbi:MAG: hydrogenase expression/formation protein HypE [Kiritimatiellae bacterium]|nr:hydrogenase expression/formation protein HypE [Kiritimatiellia bacterium]
MSRELIEQEILPRFGDGPLRELPDAATLPAGPRPLVFTTDSFVVKPIEFPGGNIGNLAVYGTVNDLAVCGAKPLWLSLSLILEEGLPISTLRRILDTIRDAALYCGASIATGDIKVVEHGACDQLYVTTSGIGELLEGFSLSPAAIREDDAVIVSGPVGDHGIAVLAAREGIRFHDSIESDASPVHRLVMNIHPLAASIHFMRDPTRGGLAAVLNEAVEGREVGIEIEEQKIPVSPGTKAVCELLGLDPLHSASEGRVVAFCDATVADEVVQLWRKLPEGKKSAVIGRVTDDKGRVVIRTTSGGRRLLDRPRGELLPRIC